MGEDTNAIIALATKVGDLSGKLGGIADTVREVRDHTKTLATQSQVAELKVSLAEKVSKGDCAQHQKRYIEAMHRSIRQIVSDNVEGYIKDVTPGPMEILEGPMPKPDNFVVRLVKQHWFSIFKGFMWILAFAFGLGVLYANQQATRHEMVKGGNKQRHELLAKFKDYVDQLTTPIPYPDPIVITAPDAEAKPKPKHRRPRRPPTPQP